ncbi:hypothetical protein EAI_02354 [Harpegnathos saltator]|uniref:MYND-type domain-containing protein n=1 Tax=Harpegnathos saltator TaxID=610380 RepID=E2C0L7_HARSA|nr:hypothetical protein EAI_02354 [Harpegnathos saltator]
MQSLFWHGPNLNPIDDEDPTTGVIKYEGEYLPKYYNQFFNPNICHVCKSVIDHGKLLQCEECHIISYCDENHKNIHHTQHNSICKLIKELVVKLVNEKKISKSYAFLGDWIRDKKMFKTEIKRKISRKLMPYENQMFMSIKSCLICHGRVGLSACENCYSVNYCTRHSLAFKDTHDKFICKKFTLSLNVNIAALTDRPTELIRDFIAFLDKKPRLLDTFRLIMTFLWSSRTQLNWSIADYVLSDYLSGPLTIYYGITRTDSPHIIDKQSNFNIHIICTNSINNNSLAAWEVLLHLFHDVDTLVITIIGQGIIPNEYKYEICELCKRFQLSLNLKPTWFQTVKAIETQYCPLFLTSPNLFKGQDTIRKIRIILNKNINPDLELKNEFHSHAPSKDYETDYINYSNKYLIIYKDLSKVNNICKRYPGYYK